jgi:hypothetical protein
MDVATTARDSITCSAQASKFRLQRRLHAVAIAVLP